MSSAMEEKRWRGKLVIGSGPPGFLEKEVLFTESYDKAKEASDDVKKLYEEEHKRDAERYRRTSIEEIPGEKLQPKKKDPYKQRQDSLTFAKKRALEYL